MKISNNLYSSIGVFAGISTLLTAIIIPTYFLTDNSIGSVAKIMDNFQNRISAYERNFARLAEDTALIREKVSYLEIERSGAIEDGVEIKSLLERISEIEKDSKLIGIIETAIIDNPEKAMSIPILRRDYESLKSNVSNDIIEIRQEIDRIYDLGKWFLGLIATMAIGLLSLAFKSLPKGKADE